MAGYLDHLDATAWLHASRSLVTIYHACHRQLSGAGGRHDYYKQYKRGGEMDEALTAAQRYLAENGVTLDAATVQALSAEIFGEVGIAGDSAGFAADLASLVAAPARTA